MNSYEILKNKHQAEINAFPMAFAFSSKQFEEAMLSLGLKPSDTDKIYKFGNTGGFYRKSDTKQLHDMLDRHECERKDAIAADKIGDGYIFEMFLYELYNHEFAYTYDAEPALAALDITFEDIENDERLAHGFQKAKAQILKDSEDE